MSDQRKKVSVIIPVYKTEKYVEETVLSVVNQKYENIEVILVDDGSPDNAPKICDELAKCYSQVYVVHKENGGLSSARNAGISNISKDSQYIFFLDSDDTILSDALTEMVNIAEENNADIIMPNKYLSVNEENPSIEKEALLFPDELCYEDAKKFVIHTIMENCRGWRATGILYSTKMIKEGNCLFPIGRISEDVIFNLQFLKKAKRIAYYSNSTIKVLKRAGSITHTFQNGFEETIYYIDEQSRKFLESLDVEIQKNQKYLDSMLCRNLVVFLFSIMSAKNSMDKKAKKAYAKKLLMDERSRLVFRYKQTLPWFESRKTKLGMKAIYTLLRVRLDCIAIALLSFIA